MALSDGNQAPSQAEKTLQRLLQMVDYCEAFLKNCRSVRWSEALLGSHAQRMAPWQELPGFGALRTWTEPEVLRLLRRLVVRSVLAEEVTTPVAASANVTVAYLIEGKYGEALQLGQLRIPLYRPMAAPASVYSHNCSKLSNSSGQHILRAFCLADQPDQNRLWGVLSLRAWVVLLLELFMFSVRWGMGGDLSVRHWEGLLTPRVRELGLKGRWQEALQLLEGLTPSEIDGVTYTASMWACVKSEQWEHAVRLFEEQWTQFRVHNDTVSCNAALCAYQQAGRWEDALKLLQEMQSSADVISYTACLNACADANQWAQAFAVHSSMLQGGVAATSSTCNAVVRSSRDGAAWKKQLQLLEEMRFRNLQPDAAALNAAASACSQAGEWRSALEMMSSMWQRALQPDDKAFCDVIDVCGRCGQWQEALRIFDLHRATALAPCAAVHAAAMRACGGARWPMALQLLEQLWETQTPDVACYEAALHCCEEARAWTEVERLYEEMLSYNLEPGEVSDKAVAAAVATTGNWERGLKLLEKRQDSAEVIGNVARACAEGHQWQKVLELLEDRSFRFECLRKASLCGIKHSPTLSDWRQPRMVGK
eukprot:g5182.t1